jgi:hypothetical protein
VLNGNDPLKSANPAAPENVPTTAIGDALAPALGGAEPFAAACIPDVTFSLLGMTKSIPLSDFCWLYTLCGNVLVSMASIIAFGIVARGV